MKLKATGYVILALVLGVVALKLSSWLLPVLAVVALALLAYGFYREGKS